MNAPERIWSDLYGCPRGVWQGLHGGHRWLVVCDGQQLGEVAKVLSTARFKGSVHVIVTGDLTPLLTAVRETSPRGVVVVGRTLRGGPAVEQAARTVELDAFSYQEQADLPAWSSALTLDAPAGECVLASACASLEVPVVSSSTSDLHRVLHLWWAQTPHSLTHV